MQTSNKWMGRCILVVQKSRSMTLNGPHGYFFSPTNLASPQAMLLSLCKQSSCIFLAFDLRPPHMVEESHWSLSSVSLIRAC